MRLRQQGGEAKSARMHGTRPAASWRSGGIRQAAASWSVGEDARHSASDIKAKRRHTASGNVVERRRWTAWRGSGPSARQHRKATALKPTKQRSLSMRVCDDEFHNQIVSKVHLVHIYTYNQGQFMSLSPQGPCIMCSAISIYPNGSTFGLVDLHLHMHGHQQLFVSIIFRNTAARGGEDARNTPLNVPFTCYTWRCPHKDS
ncbi:unnamed protein product [Urochloa humidicola]